ncbi:hypothetical protein [Kordiimonas sp.]|uniref:hypothetical protein n=1 Tax=Kordiimonas sp. TaxID=1970157 RepID=UPI003A8FF8FC
MLRRYTAAAAVVLGLGACGYAAVGMQSMPDGSGDPITSSELTATNVMFPGDLSPSATHSQKAYYAWRLFIAAMQQTDATLTSGTDRGTPSSSSTFIKTGQSPTLANPLVFESFYHRTEAFPYYTGSKPASQVGQPPVYRTYYEDNSNKVAVELTGKNYVYLDETNEIGQNFLYYQQSKDPNFPVLFMAKVSASETTYAYNMSYGPSSGQSWNFPDDVIEVKTAWRRISDIQFSDPNDYHQATANYWVDNGSDAPTLVTDTFALVAIHIIHKTANYPEFIFSTFEHVDAVTRDQAGGIVDPAYKTTYANVAYQSPHSSPVTATYTGAYDDIAPGQPPASNVNSTTSLPTEGTVSTGFTTVVQPKTITSEVNNANNAVRSLIIAADPDNIWANYRLKGVQAGPTSDTTAPDFYLANIAVESSQPGVQLFSGVLKNGGVPQGSNGGYLVNCRGDKGSTTCLYPAAAGVSGDTDLSTYKNVSLGVQQGVAVPAPTYDVGGCQGCHGAAQQLGRDFSFLANGALGKGKELDSVAASSMSPEERAAHNKEMANSSAFEIH